MAAEIEVAAMGNPFQLAKLARRQERKGVFDVGRAAGIVAQLVLVMVAQPQPVAGQAKIRDTSFSGDRASTCTNPAIVFG